MWYLTILHPWLNLILHRQLVKPFGWCSSVVIAWFEAWREWSCKEPFGFKVGLYDEIEVSAGMAENMPGTLAPSMKALKKIVWRWGVIRKVPLHSIVIVMPQGDKDMHRQCSTARVGRGTADMGFPGRHEEDWRSACWFVALRLTQEEHRRTKSRDVTWCRLLGENPITTSSGIRLLFAPDGSCCPREAVVIFCNHEW